MMAWPPHIRKVFTAKYLGGVLPKGMKANDLTLGPWVKHLSEFRGGATGIQMAMPSGEVFRVFVDIAWVINDLRGCAAPFNAKEVGAVYGACAQCAVVGSSIAELGSVYYFSACRIAGGDNVLSFKNTYARFPPLASTADRRPPKARTHAANKASALRSIAILNRPKIRGTASQNASDLNKETMRGNNNLSLLFNTDSVYQNIIDPAHQISNTVKDWLCLLRKTKGTCYIGNKRKRFCNSMGQTTPGKRPGWEGSPKVTAWVDDVLLAAVRGRLPSKWPALSPKGLSTLSTSARMLLAGDLGKYFLQFYDIEEEYKTLFADLLFCLERLQRYKHTTSSLRKLEINIQDVLAKCEHSLPPVWCSGVKHYNLHLCDFIRRCGPFQDHNMLAFERWHTLFKRLARGRLNILASIHTHWSMVLASAAWRMESQGGLEWTMNGFSSSLAGAREVDYTLRVVVAKGAHNEVQLTCDDYAQVQDLWACFDREYDNLRDKYRSYIGERRGHQNSISQLPADLSDTTIRRLQLTEKQLSCLNMTPTAYSVDTADFNSLPFCTVSYCSDLQYDDSVIKQMYEDSEEKSERRAAYAWIKRLLIHELYPGGPSAVVIDGEWLDVLPVKGPTGLTLVRKNEDNAFNRTCRFTFLKNCEPQNGALLPQDPADPGCIVFSVVDRSDKLVE